MVALVSPLLTEAREKINRPGTSVTSEKSDWVTLLPKVTLARVTVTVPAFSPLSIIGAGFVLVMVAPPTVRVKLRVA